MTLLKKLIDDAAHAFIRDPAAVLARVLEFQHERDLHDFTTQIDGLKRELADVTAARSGWQASALDAEKQLETTRLCLVDEIERGALLGAALNRYGHHDDGTQGEPVCDEHEHGPDTCTCGLHNGFHLAKSAVAGTPASKTFREYPFLRSLGGDGSGASLVPKTDGEGATPSPPANSPDAEGKQLVPSASGAAEAIRAIAVELGAEFLGPAAHSGWLFQRAGVVVNLGPTSHEVFKRDLAALLDEHAPTTSKTTETSAKSAAPQAVEQRSGDAVETERLTDGAGVPPPASSGPFVITRRDAQGRRYWMGAPLDAWTHDLVAATKYDSTGLRPRGSRWSRLTDIPALLAADAAKSTNEPAAQAAQGET